MEAKGHHHAQAALPSWKKTPVHIEEVAGWTPQTICEFWRTEKFLAPAGIRTQHRLARSLVTILELSVLR
jgi:hypothetical protein